MNQFYCINCLHLLGQGFSLHVWDSESDEPSTAQLSPPYSGAGLSHTRVLCWSAPPQLTGQLAHSLHSPQPPFTEKDRLIPHYIV